jgi:putative endonuclease
MTKHMDFSQLRAQAVVARGDAGLRAYLSGESAEAGVVRAYQERNAVVLEQRWRGEGGEIDLIVREGDTFVFIEVKKARSFDQAISRLRPAQMLRIHAAASEYLAFAPEGQLSNVRFDLAAVDGAGQIRIIENAFGHF